MLPDLPERSGGCLCGRVRYTARGEPLAVTACHCHDCQRQGGGPVSVLAVYPCGAVAIEGELARHDGIGDSGGSVERYFCSGCGSPIRSETPATRERGLTVIKAGTFDDTSWLDPGAHVWVASRQPWFALPEGVPAKERG